jgi:hypothetical protein
MIVEAKIKSRDLGEESRRHSYMIHEHSISIQVFEIDNFEFKTKLRMLQNSPPHKNLVPDIKKLPPIRRDEGISP